MTHPLSAAIPPPKPITYDIVKGLLLDELAQAVNDFEENPNYRAYASNFRKVILLDSENGEFAKALDTVINEFFKAFAPPTTEAPIVRSEGEAE